MTGIVLHFDDAGKAAIEAAADAAGMSQRAYCQRAILAAATGQDQLALIREIHSATCGQAQASPEAADALAALEQLGIGKAVASKRIAAALAESPGASAAEIIKACIKERKG